MAVAHIEHPTAGLFQEILDTRRVSCVFQPLVHLDSGTVAGFEAPARGARGSALESPSGLFAAAERAVSLPELDWICGATALEAAAGGTRS